VRERERAVLILPLVKSGRPHLRLARIAGDPVAQYSELLLDPSADGSAAFEAALASARKAGIDAIILRKVRADSHLLRLAAGHLRAPTAVSAAPYAQLSPYPDYASFLQTLSKKMRQGLRNRQNHLDRAGDVAFELLTGGAEARTAIEDAISLKRKWLVQHGAISSAFLDPSTKDCLLDLAEGTTGSGAVVLRLMVNGEPAAIRFGFEYQGTHFAYMSAYDEGFAQLSPGKMLMSFCFSQFRQRGLERIDMLPPAGNHKSDWCAFETSVADYTLPLTRSGRAYAELYQERLRPALQRTWYHLPDGIRSLAAAFFVGI
jgi:CelD/BcsL family acetyltransferase involved in cellulose biosynthesis